MRSSGKEKEKEGEGRRRKEKEKEATNIKSNNPHLAGGEKTGKLENILFLTSVNEHLIPVMSRVDHHLKPRSIQFPDMSCHVNLWISSRFWLLAARGGRAGSACSHRVVVDPIPCCGQHSVWRLRLLPFHLGSRARFGSDLIGGRGKATRVDTNHNK